MEGEDLRLLTSLTVARIRGAPAVEPDRVTSTEADAAVSGSPPPLVRVRALEGFAIRATDGALGEVEDVLVEEGSWAVRYLVVDPRRWWPGAPVLLAVDWITSLDTGGQAVVVDVTREAVRGAPTFDPRGVTLRDYEARLHDHYGRSPYWDRPVETWILPRQAA